MNRPRQHRRPRSILRVFRAERERERERRAFIGAATDLLETSLDYEATLGTLAWLAVPRLADWCAIDILESPEELRQVALVHVDPAKVERAREFLRAFPSLPSDRYGAWMVIRTGQSSLRAELSDELLMDSSRDPEQLRGMRELGLKSTMVVPLIARGRTLGVITFAVAESDRRYGEADLSVAEELAARAALAVDNARLFSEIQRGRDQLNAILSGVVDGITAQDATGRFVYANEVAARVNGFASTQEMLDTPRPEIQERFDVFDKAGSAIAPDALPAFRALRGEPASAAVIRLRRRATGEERWLVMTASPVYADSGDVQLVITISHDITERRQAERAEQLLADASSVLGESFDYSATLTKLSALAVSSFASFCVVHVVDEEGALKTVALTHADPDKLEIGREADHCSPPRPSDEHGPGKVLRTGQPELLSELTPELLRSRMASEEYIQRILALNVGSFICVPLSARGRTLGAITLLSTRRSDGYSARDLELAVELGRRAGLTVDNARLYAEATEAVRVRDEFLTIASHELKTPLTSMLLALQSIVRGARGGQPTLAADRLLPKLNVVERQSQRIAQLINQLLDISRITEGRLVLELEEIDLTELCRDVIARYADDLRAAGCAVELTAVAPVRGRWDRSRVEQVITNLLSNAMKFGHGKPIAIAVTASAERASVTVRDQGIGIAVADQPRLFQRFERAVSVRYYGGFGMGLWIARRIVEALGGTIRVESLPAQGSTFTVDLPFAGPPPPEPMLTAVGSSSAKPPAR